MSSINKILKEICYCCSKEIYLIFSYADLATSFIIGRSREDIIRIYALREPGVDIFTL